MPMREIIPLRTLEFSQKVGHNGVTPKILSEEALSKKGGGIASSSLIAG
jgi:hypothetical protein